MSCTVVTRQRLRADCLTDTSAKASAAKEVRQLQLSLPSATVSEAGVGLRMAHDEVCRRAGLRLDAQRVGIDRRERFRPGPGDAERFAADRTERAEYVAKSLHHRSYSLMSQSYPFFSSRSASDLSPEWMMRPR